MLGATVQQRPIRHYIDPNEVSPFASTPIRGDMILFSYNSSSFANLSSYYVSIIGELKHSDKKKAFSSFFLELIDKERQLLSEAFYKIPQSVVVIPFGKELIAIFTHLLRTSGLGIAIRLGHTVGNAAAIAKSALMDSLPEVLFSSEFDSIPKQHDGAMELQGELCYYASRLKLVTTFGETENASALNIIKIASELVFCRAVVEISVGTSREKSFDPSLLLAFLICIFAHAKRRSDSSDLTIKLPDEKFAPISINYKLCDKSDSFLEICFCADVAASMCIPFCFSSNDGECSIVFSPIRDDPSLMGFKSGIFIDGKPFISPLR